MLEDPGILSERELEVLTLVATGATNQQIARELVISPNTVKVHLRNIFEKLGVQSRTEATMEAVRHGWLSVPGAEAEQPQPAAPISPMILWRPPPSPRWHRRYIAAAALVVTFGLLLPFVWRALVGAPRISPFSDMGKPQTTPISRQLVARWSSGAPVLQPLSRFALVAGEDRLFAIGGEDGDGVSAQVHIYDPALNVWTIGEPKPTPVANVSGAIIGDRIYVPGGTNSDGDTIAILEILHLGTEGWESGASLPVPIAAYALAVADGKIYLFGGWDGADYRAETWIYDTAEDTWSAGAPMRRARAFAAAAPLGDELFVVGGFDGRRELSTVSAYAPGLEGTAGGPWTDRAGLSQGRAGLGVAVIRSTLYAVGGGWTEALAFNEQYDARTGAWARIGSPIVGEWRNLGLAAWGANLYAIGGWSRSYLSTNEQYLALVRQLLPLGTKGN